MFIQKILVNYPETFTAWRDCVALQEVPKVAWRRKNLFAELVLHYEEVHRRYHNFNHILNCLDTFERVRRLIPRELHHSIQTALFYHDAVYDPERNDNELRSANIARRHLLELGWSEDSLKSIYVSILATDHKGGMLVEEATKWVVDIDLSSLADQPVVFDQNTKDIRFEYEHAANFTPEKWREGRLAFAKGMLSRGYIFYTEHFRQTLEGKAIANLKRTIEELEDAA